MKTPNQIQSLQELVKAYQFSDRQLADLNLYLNKTPDCEGVEKVAQYLLTNIDLDSIHPSSFTEAVLAGHSTRLVAIVDLDFLAVSADQHQYQLKGVGFLVREVIWQITHKLRGIDPSKTLWIIEQMADLLEQKKHKHNQLVAEFIDELNLAGLKQDLIQSIRPTSLQLESVFLNWIGSSKSRQLLAHCLKQEKGYDWVERKDHVLKAFPMEGEDFSEFPIVWKGEVHALVWMIHRLNSQPNRMIRPSKGKAIWQATAATFVNENSQAFEEDFPKELNKMKSSKERYTLIINKVEEAIATALE